MKVITLRCDKELEEPIKMVRKDVVKKTVEPTEEDKSSNIVLKGKVALEIKAYKPKVSFPARLVQHKLDKQFSKFLKVFKKFYINILLTNVIA